MKIFSQRSSAHQPIVIGYQGLEGSFSEVAARLVVAQCRMEDASIIYKPLKTSAGVINALRMREIDFGLVATRNSIGGNVEETMRVIKNTQLQLKRSIVMPINQCLFKLSEEIPDEDITQIVSHIQALHQTEKFRQQHYPAAQAVEEEDTAFAAQRLHDGDYSPQTAVICSLEAGKKYGLYLAHKNIQDQPDNRTEFRLFRLPDKHYTTQMSWLDAFSRNSFITEYFYQGVVFMVLAVALLLLTLLGGNLWERLLALCGYLVSVYYFYCWVVAYFKKRALVGYWKYYPTPDMNVDERQQYHIPRVVEIRNQDQHFNLKIFTPIDGAWKISVVGNEAYSFETKKSFGKFTYEYTASGRQGADVSGFAILNWYKKHPWSRVNQMSGSYCGTRSHEIGDFTFYRITQEEFEDIQKSKFIIAGACSQS